MGQRDILINIAGLLERHKVHYLLTGSFAVAYYGYPRATHDIDFIIEVHKDKVKKIVELFSDLDNRKYLIDHREIEEAINKSTQFNIYSVDSGIKIDFWIVGEKEFDKSKFQRKREITIDKQKIKIISPEDLILTKLLWCKEIRSERHLRDCTGVWKIQKNVLDKHYLDFWAKKLGTAHLLEEVSTSEY